MIRIDVMFVVLVSLMVSIVILKMVVFFFYDYMRLKNMLTNHNYWRIVRSV